MCVVSMVMDHYWDKWNPLRHQIDFPFPPVQTTVTLPSAPLITPAEIEEFRKLLDRAREYDRRNNQGDCELDEKKSKIKKLAKELGVKIDFL